MTEGDSTTVSDALQAAERAISVLKRTKPSTKEAARARSHQLIEAQRALIDTAHAVVDGEAAQRLANASNAAPVELDEALLIEIAKGLRGWLDPILADVKQRLDVLEGRPATKEWDATRIYSVGDKATEDGIVFICTDANIGVRPAGSKAWMRL